MLVKVASSAAAGSVGELAATAREYGQRNIAVASEVLAGRGESEPAP